MVKFKFQKSQFKYKNHDKNLKDSILNTFKYKLMQFQLQNLQ